MTASTRNCGIFLPRSMDTEVAPLSSLQRTKHRALFKVRSTGTRPSICLMQQRRGGQWRHFLDGPRQPHRCDNCMTSLTPFCMVGQFRQIPARHSRQQYRRRDGLNDCGSGVRLLAGTYHSLPATACRPAQPVHSLVSNGYGGAFFRG
jgi:hypothetical protein